MKKIQLIFAALAILVASVGVFANSLVVIEIYKSQNQGANCDIQVTSEPCSGSEIQCFEDVQEGEQIVRYFYSQGDPDNLPQTCEEILMTDPN